MYAEIHTWKLLSAIYYIRFKKQKIEKLGIYFSVRVAVGVKIDNKKIFELWSGSKQFKKNIRVAVGVKQEKTCCNQNLLLVANYFRF